MADYILFMHDDATDDTVSSSWAPYLQKLRADGFLRGGSAIGAGTCERCAGPLPRTTDHLVGFIRIEARDLGHARELLTGNPVYEAGGTVEIRELPRTD